MNADLKTGLFAFEALRSTYVRTKERQCPPQEKENHQNLLRDVNQWKNVDQYPLQKNNRLPFENRPTASWKGKGRSRLKQQSILEKVIAGYTWRCRVADISKSLLEDTYLTKTQRSSACWQPQIGLAWWKAEIEELTLQGSWSWDYKLFPFIYIYMCVYIRKTYTYIYIKTFSELHDQLNSVAWSQVILFSINLYLQR